MKTPKVKKRGVSVHSRAARRANSPSLNTDKSLKTVAPPVDTTDYKPKVLGVQNAGISKKKKGKPMTRQQRLRQQKGMDRADMNNDKLEKKVAVSAARKKNIKDRAAAWEDLNEKSLNATKNQAVATTTLDEDEKAGNKLQDMTTEADAQLLPDQLALAAFGNDAADGEEDQNVSVAPGSKDDQNDDLDEVL